MGSSLQPEPPVYDPPWELVAQEFEFDGSWRDVYVNESSIDEWDSLLVALSQSPYEVSCSRAGTVDALPLRAGDIFAVPGNTACLMTVRVGAINFNCHFFACDQIEFDLDPREVTSREQLENLFAFLRFVSNTVSRPAILTPENAPEFAIFVARPNNPVVEYVRTDAKPG